jgi:single-stranded-DNA-specific exonuclease
MHNLKGKWNISGFDRNLGVQFCRAGINPLVSVLLASRGYTTLEEVNILLSGKGGDISSPFQPECPDMIKAVERIRRAEAAGEKVAVYGDYDVDGITASCVIHDYITKAGLDCEIYIPDRLEDGYGVKTGPLQDMKDRGISLVITVDCGVTAHDEIAFANSIGLDVIVTDHHECRGEVPDAVAVIDPMIPGGPECWQILAGVGVAAKLVCALRWPEDPTPENVNALYDDMIEEYGDLLALGSVADVMPMTGENRTVVRRGIEVIKKGRRAGIHELCTAAGICDKKIKAQAIGFTLAPRINAAGRLGCTKVALELMLTSDRARAAALAMELCQLNSERQALERTLLRDCQTLLEKDPPKGPIVLASDIWRQDVSGIVASRLAEKYSLPTVIICIKDGTGSGSCRSAGGFNLYGALEKCADHLQTFGGHEMAAGITIDPADIPAFREALTRCYEEALPSLPEPTVPIDLEVVKPQLLSVENVDALELLEPFGSGNPWPTLCMREVKIKNVMALSGGKHTKLWIEKCGMVFDAIFSSKSPEEIGVRAGMTADIAFVPQINTFRGQRDVQLNLISFRSAEQL